MTIGSSAGADRVVAGEWDVTLGAPPTWIGDGQPMVYCHGSGDTSLTVLPKSGQGPLIRSLAERHTIAVCDLGGQTWGNDTVITRIGQARTYLRNTWGSEGQVTLVGISMGGLAALAYALANPSAVRAVALIIPALDLNDLVVNNRGGAAADVNAAYGGAYNNATHGPTHNPAVYAASLRATMPIAIWTASDDPICVPSTADGFVTSRPQTARTDVGALGHSEASITAALDGVVQFVRTYGGV